MPESGGDRPALPPALTPPASPRPAVRATRTARVGYPARPMSAPAADRLPVSIVRLWLPMAATWLFMAAEGPLLAAVIARLGDPKANLAAFGIAYAFGLILEAPVIMMLSAATALVDGGHSFRRLRRFTGILNVAVTVALVALVTTPAWDALSALLHLPTDVDRLARVGLALLAPWPAAIGYRRFHQGLLIRAGRTRQVAHGTIVRLAAMAATAAGLYVSGRVPGAWVGCAALSAGVCTEALVARFMARHEVARFRAEGDAATPPERRLSYRGIASFYWPLAATSLLALAVQPLMTFFMGRARAPLESLAVLPVVHALTFLFRATGLSYQEVAIMLLARPDPPRAAVLRFGVWLGIGATVALGAIAWTPLAAVWYGPVSGLTPELIGFAIPPTRWLTLLPALSVLLSLQRAILVDARRTVSLTSATAAELAGVAVGLFVLVRGLDWVGATAAAVALLAGRLIANVWLVPPCLRALRRDTEPVT